jgi:hypothetical protein
MAMRKIAMGMAAAILSAGVALGMGSAHADPTLEMPSWMGGDHDPNPLIAAMQAWDPTAVGMTVTGARNEAVIICSTRNAGHSDAELLAINAETHGASDNALYRPVIRAAEAHFCPQYS